MDDKDVVKAAEKVGDLLVKGFEEADDLYETLIQLRNSTKKLANLCLEDSQARGAQEAQEQYSDRDTDRVGE